MGLDPNAFVIGTVMRNQARKLYQDLFHAFAKTLDSLSAQNRDNTYLYCHVAYPDLFHDIPELIRDCGVGRNILFTYTCRHCNNVFPSFFRDAKTYCQCGAFAAELPRAEHNLSGKVMGEIMNCFDLYVQYSTNEGFGMPLVDGDRSQLAGLLDGRLKPIGEKLGGQEKALDALRDRLENALRGTAGADGSSDLKKIKSLFKKR
jgi:hypothetical protein